MLRAFQEQKHDNRQVETICWSIVEGCIDRCDRGPLLNAYEPEKAKNNASIKTFAERLDAIVESLSHQKTICKHLLDAPYLNRFLDDPVGSKQRVESNRKLNKKKGGVMNVGKKALALEGRKGRTSGVRMSDAASDNEADEYGYETPEAHGHSSCISSPFQTPDQPVRPENPHGDAPRFGLSPLYPAERLHNETPTPSGRRQRAAATATLSPLHSRTSQPAAGQQYGNVAGITPDGGLEYPVLPMDMLPGMMVDATLPTYTSGYPYSRGKTSGSTNLYQSSSVSTFLTHTGSIADLDKQTAYTAGLNSTYHNAYADIPTSAPFGVSANFDEAEIGNHPSSSRGSNESSESNGSDDEYFPERSRKRRRQH